MSADIATDRDMLFIDDLVRFYEQSPVTMPAVDIFCCGPRKTVKRLAALVNVLCMMRTQDKRFPFSRITVVYPLSSPESLQNDEALLRTTIALLIPRLHRPEAREELSEFVKTQLRVGACSSLSVSVASAFVEAAEPHAAIIFVDAAKYRQTGLPTNHAADRSLVTIPEDMWVHHLRAFAQRCVTLAAAHPAYVVLETGEHSPYKSQNAEVLRSVSGCGVLGSEIPDDPRAVVVARLDQWQTNVRAGLMGRTFAEIDALPASLDPEKRLLKIQLLRGTPFHAQMLELLNGELSGMSEIDPGVLVRYSRYALDAGDSELCSTFLSAAVPGLTVPEELEIASDVCSDTDVPALESLVFRQLERVLPDSPRIFQHRLRDLIDSCKYTDATRLLESPPLGYPSNLAEFYREILPHLATPATPDYQAILRTIKMRWSELAETGQRLCALNARNRSLSHEALRLLLADLSPDAFSQQTALLIVRSMEQIFLQLPATAALPHDHENLLHRATIELVSYSAFHPANTTIRNALVSVLSPAVSGLDGLFLIAAVACQLCSSQTSTRVPGLWRHRKSADLEDLPKLLEPVMEWMSRESPVAIGQCILPKELLTVPADELVPPLERLLQGEVAKLIHEGDFKTFDVILFAGMLAARHSKHVGDDLVLLRLAASKLAFAGRGQKARDLTEQALQFAGNDSLRTRLAWFAYAEVYQRLHNPLEALFGVACIFASPTQITTEQAWYEIYLFMRLLRDLHMTELAKPLLPIAKALVQELGPEGEYQHRFFTIELSIRLFELFAKPDARELKSFTSDVESLCETVLEKNDETAPAASLLAQAIYLHRLLGLVVSTKTTATLELTLAKVEEPMRTTIRALTLEMPTAQQVLTLAQAIEPARYASDTGFDLQYVTIAARRLLDSDDARREPQHVALGIELLADQGFRRREGTSAMDDALHGLPRTLTEPAEFAEEFSRTGINVTLLGLSSTGHLIRLTAKKGVLGDVIREDSHVFSKAKLYEWSKQFPYGYGNVQETDNIFYTSMQALGISVPEAAPTLFILDTALAQLPPNLFLIADNFIGRTSPVAAAPSLAWLKSATNSQRNSNGHRIAWISAAADVPGPTTLSMLSERLMPTFSKHGVSVRTESEIPKDLSGAAIAIVAAHGGLAPAGRYFSVIADESSLRATSAALANALKKVELTILFVCNGGRFDRHPFANTTVGLARDILDRGGRTVIASPWPLDARVPSHWLPRFLELWEGGTSAIDANLGANEAVHQAMGDAPARCLAMTVLGDPLLKKALQQDLFLP